MTIDISEIQASRHEPQIFSMPRRKPDGRKEPAAEVGFFLQRERESRGLTVDAASEATGIHPYHIEAIETGNLTHMPPRMEAMEMIAGYAQYLGFDPEPLIEHLFSFLPAPPVAKPSFHPASPPILSSAKVLSFGKLPKIPNLKIRLTNFPGGSSGVIASVAAAFTIFIGASWALSGHGADAGSTAQVAIQAPAQPVADTMATASTSGQPVDVKVADQPLGHNAQVASNNTVADDADAIGAFLKDQPAAAKPVAVVKTKPAKVASAKIQDRIKIEEQLKTATAIAPIPHPADGRVYGAENKDAHVVLKATAPVWLRIEDAQGVAVMTQMLNTGDTYLVPNKDGLIALSRDGGRLAYIVDGQEKGALGPPGKILVSEKLDVVSLNAKKQQASN